MPFDGNPEVRVIPQVVTDLTAARDYLDEYGWCQGHLVEGPRRCLVGAIRQVCLGDGKRKLTTVDGNMLPQAQRAIKAEWALRNYLNAHMNSGHRYGYDVDVAWWNDRHNYRDVRGLLNLVIADELAKEKGNAI